tara:strand:- start:48 stop:470 length:423 start_codon:yes stop_codon:yes gene_type:complete
MTPEEKKEYMKEYRKNNKEKEKEYREANKEKMKEYREANKEKMKEYNKEYNENNKEKRKEYNQTEQYKKNRRIYDWIKRGLIHDDFPSLYDYYINCNNCEECNIELVEGNFGANKRCLDHSHTTGLFRNVLCTGCNLRRG